MSGPGQSIFASRSRTKPLARLKGELMQPENDLRNKRVIVIGGSSGIGLALPATRNEFRELLNPSEEKRRARRWTSPMKGPSKPSLRSLGQSITWYIRLVIGSNSAT